MMRVLVRGGGFLFVLVHFVSLDVYPLAAVSLLSFISIILIPSFFALSVLVPIVLLLVASQEAKPASSFSCDPLIVLVVVLDGLVGMFRIVIVIDAFSFALLLLVVIAVMIPFVIAFGVTIRGRILAMLTPSPD